MSGNFDFLKDINSSAYNHIISAEKQVVTNFDICNDVRNAMELLVQQFIDENDKNGVIRIPIKNGGQSLSDKIYFFRNEKLCKSKGITPLPKLAYVRFEAKKKKDVKIIITEEKDIYFFLRKFGNSGSHPEELLDYVVVLSYEMAIKALEKFHIMARTMFNCKGVAPFKEELIPVGDYKVINSSIPVDAPYTYCKRQIEAYSDNDSLAKQYSIINIYNKNNLNVDFLKRNAEVITKILDSNPEPPLAVVRMNVLASMDAPKTPFYIVAYNFNTRHPVRCSSEILKKITLKNRLEICCYIAEGLAALHSEGVYHRFLSYDSIFFTDWTDRNRGWIPGILGFNFAKIIDSTNTILPETIKAYNAFKKMPRRAKYLPGLEELASSDWEKIDVWAAGMLFGDILSGQLNSGKEALEENLGEADLGPYVDEIINVLADMLDEDRNVRPSMEKIAKTLKEILGKWN